MGKILTKMFIFTKSNLVAFLFYAFLLTSTLSVRKILFFHPINNTFNEYASIFIYISDFILLIIILLYLLYNKLSFLSIKDTPLPKKIIFFFLLSIWSFLSIAWSEHKNIALFRSIKTIEFIIILIIILKNVPRGTFTQNIIRFLISIGAINSIIGILQFINKSSIGLYWLKESYLSTQSNGVAKIILDGEKYVRAYGLFPHPNILGGFLMISILFTIYKIKRGSYFFGKKITPERNGVKENIKCSTWNNSNCEVYSPINKRRTIFNKIYKIYRFILESNLFLLSILTLQIIATFLTFSKSAIFGLIIAILFINRTKCVPRGTSYIQSIRSFSKKITSVPRGTSWIKFIKNILKIDLIVPRGTTLQRKLFLLFLIFISTIIIIKPDLNSLLIKSISDRLLFLDVSRGTIASSPLLGLGMGQFVLEISKHTNLGFVNWQLQPVHNVFILIISELGIIGLFLFTTFIVKLFLDEKNETAKNKFNCSTWNNSNCEIYTNSKISLDNSKDNLLTNYLRGILVGIIFIMMFDHYWWDINQGQTILAIITGLLISESKE